MAQVKYVGPSTDGVEIADTGQVVLPGEVVDVDVVLAAGLCEQESNWQPVTPAKSKPVKGEEG